MIDKKTKQEIEKIEYYKCPTCGAVGNWKEFIEAKICHAPKIQSPQTLQDELNML